MSLSIALLSILFAVLPLISVLIAVGVANVFNCPLDESGASSCPTPFGDVGEVLSVMAIFGWLIFFTVPIGLIGLLCAVILLIASLVAGRNKAPKTLH